MSSIFTKIINREIPAYIVYEDEYVIAFLDIEPVQPGHVLIVPKVEIDHIDSVPEPFYGAIFETAKRISIQMKQQLHCTRVGSSVHGFDVPHAHYHLIPVNNPEDMYAQRKKLDTDEMKRIQGLLEL